MTLDPLNTSPVFRQIADGLRGAIAAGVYTPGDLVPSIRETALRLLVNPNTVKRAYEQLEREGLITSRPGVGMVVQNASAEGARSLTAAAVLGRLTEAVATARRAALPRTDVDSLYRTAWDQSAAPARRTQDSAAGAQAREPQP